MTLKLALAASLLTALLAGCADDGTPESTGEFSVANPWSTTASYANVLPEGPVTGLEPVARLSQPGSAEPWFTGSGNFVLGDYVFGSALNHGFFIADVSDPANPTIVYNATADSETPFARKAEVIAHPDGRRTLVLATQTNGMHFWDVTDPANAVWASSLEFTRNHYVAVVPGTELVFNNPSAGTGGDNALVDAHDPYNPVILGTYGSYGCHGTTFQGKPGDALFRAYCAGIQRTEVWDLSGLDVAAPHFGIELLTYVDVADNPVSGTPITNPPIPSNPTGVTTTPVRSLHHFATASDDGSILIVGDEHRGGGNPGACFYNDPVTGKSTPLGALWFFDISNPADPTLLSWMSPPLVEPTTPTVITNVPGDPGYIGQQLGAAYTAVPNCTAHFGQVIPGKDALVIGWYSAGVLLISFADPANPVILDQYQPEGINTWSARYQDGYVFTGDIARGMEVLKIV